MPKKKDVWVILVVLVIALCVAGLRMLSQRATIDPTQLTSDVTKPAEQPAAFGPSLPKSDEPIKGYAIILVGQKQYGDPIPMDRDKTINIKQDNGQVNEIKITKDSVEMHASSCENQDCVHQGIITRDNYLTRILGSYVVCLPNEVTIQYIAASQLEGALE